jgi:hypothetical protein
MIQIPELLKSEDRETTDIVCTGTNKVKMRWVGWF